MAAVTLHGRTAPPVDPPGKGAWLPATLRNQARFGKGTPYGLVNPNYRLLKFRGYPRTRVCFSSAGNRRNRTQESSEPQRAATTGLASTRGM